MNTSETRRAILLNAADSVAVSIADVEAGDSVTITGATGSATQIKALSRIPAGHKLAVRAHNKGDEVVKYGRSIGKAKTRLEAGAWIHVDELASDLATTDAARGGVAPYTWRELPALKELLADAKNGIPTHFDGYRRPDGSVGIRNEVWVLPTVGCVSKTAERLAEIGRTELGLESFAFTHPYGCSQLGDDLEATRAILAGLARNPNAAGILVVSLGCENLRLELFRSALGGIDLRRVKFLSMQTVGDEMAEGRAMLASLKTFVDSQKREPIPLSQLCIGMKCGGSDGFSGISANPLVGRISDFIAALGGKTVLTEVPEMFGAEEELIERSGSSEMGEAIVTMVRNFKNYFTSHGQDVDENPSPGNRDGGITTLAEKSLGCIRKGGSVPVSDVLPYAGRVTKPGLSLVAGPGNDLVSTTNLSAAGAHMILFTTGRGTPFGAPVPTVKISSNSDLAARKPGWIDFDAGTLLAGRSFDDAAIELFKFIVSVASGKKTKSEASGNRDIAIFKDGVTL